jgi:hypothetical protein
MARAGTRSEPGWLGGGFGRGDLDREQAFQERGVPELLGGGTVQLGGQRLGRRGQAQRGQVPA